MNGLRNNRRCKAPPAVTTPVTALVARVRWIWQNGHEHPGNEKEIAPKRRNALMFLAPRSGPRWALLSVSIGVRILPACIALPRPLI